MSRAEAAKQYSLGQKLYYAEKGSHARHCNVVVTKVGTKWVYFKREDMVNSGLKSKRFDPRNGNVDDTYGFDRGRVYFSKREYEKNVLREALWVELRREMMVHYRAPECVTLESLIDATRLLGFDEEKLMPDRWKEEEVF